MQSCKRFECRWAWICWCWVMVAVMVLLLAVVVMVVSVVDRVTQRQWLECLLQLPKMTLLTLLIYLALARRGGR